jgi:hypothetical protein
MAANNDYAKTITFLDTNLISSSFEDFRTAAGAYWDINSSSAEGEFLQFGEGNTSFDTNNQYNLPLNTYMQSFSTNQANAVTLAQSDEVLAPAYRYPVRIVGDSSNIQNDREWSTIVMGGTYGDNTHSGLYNNGAYDCTIFQYYIPYPKQEAKMLRGPDFSNQEPIQQIEIGYNYQDYIESYEDKISSIDTVTLIPNLYFFEIFKGQQDNLALSVPEFNVNSDIVNYANFGELTNLQLSEIYDDEITSILPLFHISSGDLTNPNNQAIPNATEYKDRTHHLRKYLGTTYAFNEIADSAAGTLPTQLKNVLFDDKAFESGGLLQNMEDDLGRFPYYVKINFPADNSGALLTSGGNAGLKDAIIKNNFSQKFIKILKEAFLEETEDVPLHSIETIRHSHQNTANWQAESASKVVASTSAATTTTIKTISLPQMLMSCYNNYNSQMGDCYFMGEETDLRESAMSDDNTRRYENTLNTIGVLNYVNDVLQDATYNSVEELLAAGGSPNEVNASTGKQENMETVAYRIEKIGGNPQGDTFTGQVLQNYWFFNTGTGVIDDMMKFYDSQVRYGIDYTYKVYAYAAVVGNNYEYSDITVTKQIGTAQKDTQGVIIHNCLEFFSPGTEQPTDQLYNTTAEVAAMQSGSPAATNAQYIGKHKYLADFYVTYSPTLKIVEIPLYAKSLKITDHPPSRLDVIPYQLMNDSQTIGFALNYEFFIPALFPIGLTESEAVTGAEYAHANDLYPGEKVSLDSISRARYVEVYRLLTKPQSLSDFGNHIYQTIDLRMLNTTATYNTTTVTDTIRTNTKYYYLFRGLNEHGIPGPVSEIYEAELINDGGYKYAVFNTLYEQDLQEEVFTEPSKMFKKLMQLKPNIAHLTFDTKNADFSETARSQIDQIEVGNSPDSIWGKTFKIRMTSKKTGKKIDLNITYNLENDQ